MCTHIIITIIVITLFVVWSSLTHIFVCIIFHVITARYVNWCVWVCMGFFLFLSVWLCDCERFNKSFFKCDFIYLYANILKWGINKKKQAKETDIHVFFALLYSFSCTLLKESYVIFHPHTNTRRLFRLLFIFIFKRAFFSSIHISNENDVQETRANEMNNVPLCAWWLNTTYLFLS